MVRAVGRAERQSSSSGRTYGVALERGEVVELPPHHEAVSEADELRALVERCQRPLAADLFCGAGGLSLGLEAAGFEVVLGVDNDEFALNTHRAHHAGLSVNWDLGDPDVVEATGQLIRDVGIDLVAGGPPCQPFSKAGRSGLRSLVREGRRAAHDERRDLWESFLRIVSIAEPAAVLMENVPDMALDQDMMILRSMHAELEALGYAVKSQVVESWRYGVPQHRQRLIMVALRDQKEFVWPAEVEQLTTLSNAISDLPPVEGGWLEAGGADGFFSYEGPRSSYQRRMREGVTAEASNKVFDHITRRVREDDAEIFESMDASTKYSEIDPSLKRYRDDIFDDKYKRLDFDKVSRSITAHIAKDGYWYIHPEQHRTLTMREAARIQSFPDHVRFAGPPTAALRQIGNAVPPMLAEALGGAILASLEQNEASGFSAATTATALSDWFQRQTDLRIPWLRAPNRWVALQSELMLDRLPFRERNAFYEAVARCLTPAETLENEGPLRRLASICDRQDRLHRVLETAAYFLEHPEHLEWDAPLSGMATAPHVTKATAMLVCRIVPGPDEDPVVVSKGVLRVAARHFGTGVDQRNRLSDGRMAVAALIGGEDNSHEAHLALLELSQEICSALKTSCAACPLERTCRHAQEVSVQQVLGEFTNQAGSQ